MADIKSRLQLDGEQEYKKALNDAYRSLRVLRSELKAETAEMGKNATAQDKAGKKADSLKKQIEQQKKIVETLKKALADSRKEYADNQEVQDKWAEKLNKAREQLANMQNQMKTAQDTMHGFGDAMKDVADSSGEAAQGVVSINDCLKSIGSIAGGVGNTLSNIFTSTVDTMKAMVDEMHSLMAQAWSAAGDWKQIQTIWGGNLEDIEMVMTGASLQGVDQGVITGGIQKLINNVHGKNKETMSALKKLGLKESDSDSHWDFFMDVMDKLYTRKGEERYLLASQLFGDGKGAGMTDLIDNWMDMKSKYGTDVEGTGLKLFGDEIEALDEVGHKVTEIQAMWEAMKTTVGARLVDVLDFSDISEDALQILQDVAKIFTGTGDRKELVIELENDLTQLLEDIAKAMENLSGFIKEISTELEGSTNPTIAFLGKVLSSIADVLDWVGEHSDTIIEWLNKLLPLMMSNKVLEATTGQGLGGWMDTLGQLGIGVAQISLLGKVFGQSANASIGAAAMGTAMGSGFGTALMTAVPWLAGLVTLLTPGSTAPDEMNSLADFYANAGTLEEYVEKMTRNGAMSAEAAAAQYKNMEAIILSGNQANSAPIAETTADKLAPYVFSGQQIMAAQDYWDAFREGSDSSDEWEALRLAFEGDTEVLNKLVEKITQFYETDPSSTFLPASLFNSISGNNKNLELKTTNQITVNVNIDGETVQRNVSEHMAKNLMRLVGA